MERVRLPCVPVDKRPGVGPLSPSTLVPRHRVLTGRRYALSQELLDHLLEAVRELGWLLQPLTHRLLDTAVRLGRRRHRVIENAHAIMIALEAEVCAVLLRIRDLRVVSPRPGGHS